MGDAFGIVSFRVVSCGDRGRIFNDCGIVNSIRGRFVEYR